MNETAAARPPHSFTAGAVHFIYNVLFKKIVVNLSRFYLEIKLTLKQICFEMSADAFNFIYFFQYLVSCTTFNAVRH